MQNIPYSDVIIEMIDYDYFLLYARLTFGFFLSFQVSSDSSVVCVCAFVCCGGTITVS